MRNIVLTPTPEALAFDQELFGEDFLDARREEVSFAKEDKPFKLCKDCSGSTAPTCKKNQKCIGKL